MMEVLSELKNLGKYLDEEIPELSSSIRSLCVTKEQEKHARNYSVHQKTQVLSSKADIDSLLHSIIDSRKSFREFITENLEKVEQIERSQNDLRIYLELYGMKPLSQIQKNQDSPRNINVVAPLSKKSACKISKNMPVSVSNLTAVSEQTTSSKTSPSFSVNREDVRQQCTDVKKPFNITPLSKYTTSETQESEEMCEVTPGMWIRPRKSQKKMSPEAGVSKSIPQDESLITPELLTNQCYEEDEKNTDAPDISLSTPYISNYHQTKPALSSQRHDMEDIACMNTSSRDYASYSNSQTKIPITKLRYAGTEIPESPKLSQDSTIFLKSLHLNSDTSSVAKSELY